MVDWSGWFFIFIIVILALRNEQGESRSSAQRRGGFGYDIVRAISNSLFAPGAKPGWHSRRALRTLPGYAVASTKTAAELAHKKRQLSQMGEEYGNSQMMSGYART